MTLQNGIKVRLGRRDVAERTDLFLGVVTDIIASREKEIEYVDMRYSSGFTIGWNGGATAPAPEQQQTEQGMVAARGIN
jgi:cell division protein FtsQ